MQARMRETIARGTVTCGDRFQRESDLRQTQCSSSKNEEKEKKKGNNTKKRILTTRPAFVARAHAGCRILCAVLTFPCAVFARDLWIKPSIAVGASGAGFVVGATVVACKLTIGIQQPNAGKKEEEEEKERKTNTRMNRRLRKEGWPKRRRFIAPCDTGCRGTNWNEIHGYKCTFALTR